MENKIEEIIRLDEQIDSMSLQGTSAYQFGAKQKLSVVDKKILEYYQEMLDVMIEILKEKNTKDIRIIDDMLKEYNNKASEMLDDFVELLQYYSELDEKILKDEIEILSKIDSNIELNKELSQTILIELADSYFRIGEEEKARKIVLNYIRENPDEDEPYMCMQNWYIYYRPDFEKLAEVMDLAEENNHILVTDFGYDELIKHYDDIGDIKSKEKYEELYKKWKEKRGTIEI